MTGLVDIVVVVTDEQAAELRTVVNSRDVSAVIATRARIVLWMAEGRRRKEVGELAGVSLPTVDRWVHRYESRALPAGGVQAGWAARAGAAARILALTRATPPSETGLSHWSSREMAAYVTRTERVSVSWHYVAKLWRDNDLQPAPAGHVQTVERSALRGQGRRRGWAVPGPSGRGRGAVVRREDPIA